MIGRFFSMSAIATMAAASLSAMPSAAESQVFVPRGYHAPVPVQYYRGDRYYRRGYDRYYDRRARRAERRAYRDYRRDRRYYADRGYYGRGYYGRGRGYYRCDRGTGGTIVGAIAGGLLGNEVGRGRYGYGDGTAGAIIGGGLGALAGRAIDRDC